MGFFDTKQGAAEFKHAVLERYVPVFAQKVGLYSSGHQVHLLDGYAGQGWYDDDSPGSPALLLATARALQNNRRIDCWFVEEDAANYRTLQARLQQEVLSDQVHPFQGTMAGKLPVILEAIGTSPLFALVDPFGIGLPFDCLVNSLLRREGKTEVLVSFIHAGVNRNAGRLTQQTDNEAQIKVAEKVLPALDANLGGEWWREVWLEPGFTTTRLDRIRDRYVRMVLDSAGQGWRCYRLPVSDKPDAAVIYDMLLFTRNGEGPWCFNDAVSNAREAVEGPPGVTAKAASNQLSLWDVTDDWVGEIEGNLRRLLPPGGRQFRSVDRIDEIYGRLLGFARSKHVCEAARRLHDEGVISSTVKGVAPEKLVFSPRPAVQTA